MFSPDIVATILVDASDAHQTIGILAELLVHYENHAIEAKLARDTPPYWTAQCLAAHAPELPSTLRSSLKKAGSSDKALKAAQDELFKDPAFRALVGTTQAVDIIGGGVKSNALPENAFAVINHRIATDRSVWRSLAPFTCLEPYNV